MDKKTNLKKYQLYYLNNKDKIAEKNRRYYLAHREELLEKYEEQRVAKLKYQKQYARKKSNRARLQAYNREYYQRRKANPTYKMQIKMAASKYHKRIKKIKSEQRCIERTKRLMAKMCRELIRKVPLIVAEPEPEPELLPQSESKPFADFKVDKRGYYYLEW
jgi:hypothetical protein